MVNNPTEMYGQGETPKNLSPRAQKAFQYIEFDNEEELLAEIRKHPIGLVFIALSGILVSIAILAITITGAISLPKLGFDFGASTNLIRTVLVMLGVVLVAFIAVITLITAFIYRANVIFLTNDKLAEVSYLSLFNRKVIQQNIGRVEDVTVMQRGILPRMFDYGTLIVETAGEKERLTFTQVPRPYQNSKLIVQCHEGYIKRYGN